MYPLGLSEEGQQRRVSVFGLDYSCLILNEISGNGRKDEYCIATTVRSRDVTCDTLPGPFTILGDL